MPRRICQWWKKLKEYLQNLNIFPSVLPSTDEHDLRNQRISTRLFLFIFSVSFIILLSYISLETNTKTIYVELPSFTKYALLSSTYRETLVCPCSNISINYDKFLHVEYTFHQVCNSIFLNEIWLQFIRPRRFHPIDLDTIKSDFQETGQYAFQALKTFCELINRTISNSQVEFYSNQYISASVIPEDVFELETKLLAEGFRSLVTNAFSLSLLMIRNTTQANALLSALQTNYFLQRSSKNTNFLGASDMTYDNCSCSSSAECASQSVIHDYSDPAVLFDVPDFYVGCYPIETFLKSTLKCFYNQSCIDQIKSYIAPDAELSFISLNVSSPSRYSVNSTIQELVDDLMIEEWNASTMYERYYNACQPTQCTYQIQTRHDIIYIVTTLFGVAGGLTTALKLIAPRLVKLVRKRRGQQQQHSDTGKIKSK